MIGAVKTLTLAKDGQHSIFVSPPQSAQFLRYGNDLFGIPRRVSEAGFRLPSDLTVFGLDAHESYAAPNW